jgi:hypothetical protein
VLAIPRTIDVMPIGGVELFASASGVVPNDGAPHALTPPAGAPSLVVPALDRVRVDWVRAEWSTVDLTVPPPLTLSVLVNGQADVAFQTLTSLMLLALAIGTPAMELDVFAEVAPGATIALLVTNTGAVSQLVSAYLHGWAYPQSTLEGAGYGSNH